MGGKGFKKPGMYGWGWLLLFSIMTGFGQSHRPLNSLVLELLWIGLTLMFYFWLRRKFIAKWEFSPFKPGLLAGLCSLILYSIIILPFFTLLEMRLRIP